MPAAEETQGLAIIECKSLAGDLEVLRMGTSAETAASSASTLSGLVPMIHVASVERSIEFYRLLGLEVGTSVPPAGPLHWAWLYAPKVADWKRGPNLMVTRSAKPINAAAQEVLLYLYAADLKTLREELLAAGVKVGEIGYPDYLPNGEFEMHDPDGYLLMVAQSAQDTP
jgi:catechol 2,3-dioxygenase-like lactoylglutathione lyase family enzyme